MYDKIFSRGKINGVELKNRVIMGPMDESLGDNSGNVSSRCMEYFLARAKGGTAALVTSYVAVCPPELGGIAMPGQLRLISGTSFLWRILQKESMLMGLSCLYSSTIRAGKPRLSTTMDISLSHAAQLPLLCLRIQFHAESLPWTRSKK